MTDKIWSEHDLQKRNEVAAKASQAIAGSKNPRQMAKFHMPELIRYEILPNYVFDDWTDDKIRQLAIEDLSPPKRLSKAANYDYYSKFPSLSVEQCIMLLINVEPGTPIRTQAEKDRYDEILQIAESYLRRRRAPFDGDHSESVESYEIAPDDFIKWAKFIGEVPPPKWQPDAVSPKHSEQATPQIHVERYEEAVKAAILLLEEGPPPRHIANHLIPRIRDPLTPDEFPACRFCPSDKSLVSSIRKGGRSIRKGGSNPLEDPRYVAALRELDK